MSAQPKASRGYEIRRPAAQYALAVIAVLAVLALRRSILEVTGPLAPYLLFVGVVLLTALLVSFRAAILATLLSGPLASRFLIDATPQQTIVQVGLFYVDCGIALYLSHLMLRARRSAERFRDEIVQSTKRYREPIDLAPEAFLLASLDGRFTLVNDAACRMLGWSREELLEMTISEIVAPEDLPRVAADKEKMLGSGVTIQTDSRLRKKDGSYVDVEVVANIIGDRWQAFARDITERKRAEDERKVFKSLIESSSDFIGIADPQGTPIYINPAGRQMIGMPPDYPIENTSTADYYATDQRAFAQSVIAEAMRGQGRWSGETAFRHWQTGAAIPVSADHFMIYDATGTRVLGAGTVTRDISEALQSRRQIEAALAQRHESEELLRLAIEQAPIGMALVALDGRFLQVNRALCETVHYTPEELLQKYFQDITHPDDLAGDLEQAARLARGEIESYRLEKRYLRRDGGAVAINLSVTLLHGIAGRPPVYIAQVEDITDRKRAESALQLLAQAGATLTASLELDYIMTSVAELVVRDMADWCIVEVAHEQTRRVRAATALPEKAAMVRAIEQASLRVRRPLLDELWNTGQPVLIEHVTPDELPAYAANDEHLQYLRDLGVRSLLAVPLTSQRRQLGIMVWSSSSAERSYDRKDVALAQTLAGRVALAVENTRLYQTAVQATKLRDQVLGVVAHDLRNPLSVIKLAAEQMQPSSGQPERRAARPVQIILRTSERMSHLIQDLLEVTQIEAGQLGITRERISATTFVTDTVESMRSLASSSSLDLALELPRDLPDIVGDHDRLHQVIENLIGNAMKFTPAGGRIAVGAKPQGRELLYYVADTGRGIPAEHLPHVFDRFWQAKKGTHGAGLGLPIARGVVEALGGRIWVESTPGLGTTFFFTMPIAASNDEHGRDQAGAISPQR